MRILGIDPGLRLTGYACLERADDATDTPVLLEAGVFRLSMVQPSVARPLVVRPLVARLSEPCVSKPMTHGSESRATEIPSTEKPAPDSRSTASVSARLVELDRDFRDALERLKPEVVAVESLFAHYKHPTTAIVMGHARGVLLLAIQQAGCRLVELKPNEVKKSLTGHGHASKAQMQHAVQSIFGLAEPPDPPDIADAIAIALCASTRLSGVHV